MLGSYPCPNFCNFCTEFIPESRKLSKFCTPVAKHVFLMDDLRLSLLGYSQVLQEHHPVEDAFWKYLQLIAVEIPTQFQQKLGTV